MAVKIRLKRMGAKKKPFYRIIVADSRSPRDGRFIEEIGTYDPLKDPSEIKVNGDKAIVASGRPQAVPRDENAEPAQPKTYPVSKAKPAVSAPKTNTAPPKATANAPVRSRSEVISTASRGTRGF